MARRALADAERQTVARALLLTHRYSVDISAIANRTLGAGMASNKDIRVLLEVMDAGTATPGAIAHATGFAASDVSRSLGRLQARELVHRERSRHDRRGVDLVATPAAQRRQADFARALGDYFDAAAPAIKELVDLVTHDLGTPIDPGAGRLTVQEAAAQMAAAGATVTRALQRAGAPYGLRAGRDRHIVALIGAHPDMRPAQVADHLRLSRATASETLARLDRAGLIERLDDPSGRDRRAVHLRLTPRGRRAWHRQLDAFAEGIGPLVNALAGTLRVRRNGDSAEG